MTATVAIEESLIRQLVGRPTLTPQAALGAGLLPEHFADPTLRMLFAAVRRIAVREEVPDAADVEAELRRRDQWTQLADEYELLLIGAHNTAAEPESVVSVALTRAAELLRLRQDEIVGAKHAQLGEVLGADPKRAAELLEELARFNALGAGGGERLEPLWLDAALARKLPPLREYVDGVLQVASSPRSPARRTRVKAALRSSSRTRWPPARAPCSAPSRSPLRLGSPTSGATTPRRTSSAGSRTTAAGTPSASSRSPST